MRKDDYWRTKKPCPDCGVLIAKYSQRCHPCSRKALRIFDNKYLKNSHVQRELRKAIFVKLGDKCAICGFSDPRALHIDHIKNDGYIHRKEVSGYKQRLRQILNDEDGRYQILCANCNFIKKHNALTERLEKKYAIKRQNRVTRIACLSRMAEVSGTVVSGSNGGGNASQVPPQPTQ